MRALHVDRLVAGFADTDAMPTSVSRLCALIADSGSDITEITAVIEHDQVLTGHLLRRANSAASSALEPVRTVRDAAVRLGPAEVLSVALAASVSGLLRRAQPAYALDEGDLWRRAVAASVAAEAIRTRSAKQLPREVGTAALLHDIGKVVIGRTLPLEHLRELRRVHHEAIDASQAAQATQAAHGAGPVPAQLACLHDEAMLRAERDVLGVDHAEVGRLMTMRWGLPQGMTEAVALHHERRIDRPPTTLCVSLAHAMVVDVLAGQPRQPGPSTVPDAYGAVMLALGLDPGAYAELNELAVRRFRQVSSTYEV